MSKVPAPAPDDSTLIAQSEGRIAILEAVAPKTQALSLGLIDAFYGIYSGPSVSSGTGNPIFPSNDPIALDIWAKDFVGESFIDDGDLTSIQVKSNPPNGQLYCAVATLFFTTDPTGARVAISSAGGSGSLAAFLPWMSGFPFGIGAASPAQITDPFYNCLQATAVFAVVPSFGDTIGVEVVVEDASGLELTSFPVSAVVPGASNLIIFPVGRTYVLSDAA